jgi:hypothetical protein
MNYNAFLCWIINLHYLNVNINNTRSEGLEISAIGNEGRLFEFFTDLLVDMSRPLFPGRNYLVNLFIFVFGEKFFHNEVLYDDGSGSIGGLAETICSYDS